VALLYQHDRFWFVTPAIENKLTLSALLSRHRTRISNKDSITHELSPPFFTQKYKKKKKIFFLFLHERKMFMTVRRGPKKKKKKLDLKWEMGVCGWLTRVATLTLQTHTHRHTHT
jgi:hypothetical protein